MNDEFAENVYLTLQGLLVPSACVPGVENLFETGSECDCCYNEMLLAYGRLCDRLGAGEEDCDVETILRCMMRICDLLALKMFEYGAALRKSP